MFPADADLRILVFGGSIGLEALTLSRMFTKAQIVTVDVSAKANTVALRIAAAEPRIAPRVCHYRDIADMAMFDIILAHSVLCDHPGAIQKAKFDQFDFHHFSDVLETLAGRLHPRGVLSLINASFCIEDTSLAQELRKLDHFVATNIPKFAPDGRKICQVVQKSSWIFAQAKDGEGLPDIRERLRGSLFSKTHPGPVIPPALVRLAPEDMLVNRGIPKKFMLPGFVDLPTVMEVFEVPSNGGLAQRMVLACDVT
jgi:hypothetical protein